MFSGAFQDVNFLQYGKKAFKSKLFLFVILVLRSRY